MKLLRSGGDYSYAYGVVSGKGRKLFSRKQIEDLAMYKSVGEITAFLEGTEYERDIHGAVGKKVDPIKLEKSILNHFFRIFREIISTLPQADKETMEELIMGNIEAENMEIIIRMIHRKLDPEETGHMLTPCRWKDDFVSDIISSQSIKELVEKLGKTEYHEPLEQALDKYEDEKSTVPLETALEKFLAKKWLTLQEKIAEDLKSYIEMKIDAMNIRSLLRLITEERSREGAFVEGGKYLTRKMFDEAESIEDALEVLNRTPYINAVKEGLEYYGKSKSFVHLENILYRENVQRFADEALFNPPSMSSIILFISRKKMEIKNLRRIVVCKANDVPQNEIKELLL